MMNQERKDKIISLFEDSAQEKKNGNTVKSGDKNVLGQGNIVINGNVTVQDRPKQQPEFITQGQAYNIQQQIYRIADLDVACGFSSSGVAGARKKWWYILRTHFKTTSYKMIPHHQYGAVMEFLDGHLAKIQHTLTETNNKPWRNKYYAAIYAKCNETGIKKEQLYRMVEHYLNIRVTSLKDLKDGNLNHLYNIIIDQHL